MRAYVAALVSLVLAAEGFVISCGTAATAGAETQAPHVRRGTIEFNGDPADTTVPEPFRLAGHRFDYEARWPQGDVRSDHWEVVFPSPIETPSPRNNQVHCEYFPPRTSGPRPGVIVLHILGGDFELSRLCCRALASSGCGALFVKMPYYGPRRDPSSPRRMVSLDPEETVAGMTQAVLDIRRATAWLADQAEIARDDLGITGISLGGIVSALAASAEPRLEKACLVLAGGDIERVAWQTQALEPVRRHWLAHGLTEQQVRMQLRRVDPVTYADRLQGRRILMINARHDEIIPSACTESLWTALGKPEIVWWNAGHFTAAFFLPEGLNRICRFFEPSHGM